MGRNKSAQTPPTWSVLREHKLEGHSRINKVPGQTWHHALGKQCSCEFTNKIMNIFLFCPTLFWQPFYLGSEGETCISCHPSQLWRAWSIELVNRIQIDATLSWIDHLHKSNSIPTNMTHTKQTFLSSLSRAHTSLFINPDHHLSLLEGFHFKSRRVNLIKIFTSHQGADSQFKKF